MQSVNELLQEEIIRHQVELQAYESGVVASMLRVLRKAERDILAELAAVLADVEPSSFRADRLNAMLSSVRAMSAAAFSEMQDKAQLELEGFTQYEIEYQQMLLAEHLPAVVSVASVSAPQVWAAAKARPFQGVLLKEVWKDLDASTMKRLRQTIALGFVEGKTTDQIIREIRGSKSNDFKDGLFQKSRRDVEAVVRTAIGHTAGVANDAVMDANADLVKYLRISATLDLRTSPQCRLRDGLLYTPERKPVGHKVPWGAGPGRYHFRCRTGQTTILKSFADLGVDVPEIVTVGRTRASMDGQIPADVSYADWIKRQPFERQAEVLGETRARLMRDGKMPLPEFYTPTGRVLTLKELRQRDAEAFHKAGL